MIIEIRGLPEGQKIKKLTVDVDFDEEGNASTITRVKPASESQLPSVNTSTPMPPVKPPRTEEMKAHVEAQIPPVNVQPPMTQVSQPNVDGPREAKEIPPEMKDISF